MNECDRILTSARGAAGHRLHFRGKRNPAMPTLSTATDRTADIARAAAHASLRDPQEMAVTARGELVSFTSRLSDDAALDLLQWCPGSFARSLWNQSQNRQLSPAQLAWAHKLATDLLQQESQQQDDSGEPQFAKLFDTFKAAKARGLKRLTLRLSGVNVKPNRDLTMLWVTSQTEKEEGNYGLQPKYLGKVTPNRLDSRIPDDVKAVLLEAAADPLTAAIRYGRETGSCSCCGRDLTNKESIRLGIGPICREKFGL
jgi:hypothetical protein